VCSVAVTITTQENSLCLSLIPTCLSMICSLIVMCALFFYSFGLFSWHLMCTQMVYTSVSVSMEFTEKWKFVYLPIPTLECNESAKLLFTFCFYGYGKSYTSLYRTVLRVDKYLEFSHTLLVLHNLICFIYGSSFCLEQTLGPRIGYLPLLIPVIKAHFSNALPPGVDTVWFEYEGLPLKW
jgi:hypothetical protein